MNSWARFPWPGARSGWPFGPAGWPGTFPTATNWPTASAAATTQSAAAVLIGASSSRCWAAAASAAATRPSPAASEDEVLPALHPQENLADDRQGVDPVGVDGDARLGADG